MGKNASVGMKMASQKSSGAPKDGSFRDISPTKNKPQCPYNNPATGKGQGRGVVAQTKKMGSN